MKKLFKSKMLRIAGLALVLICALAVLNSVAAANDLFGYFGREFAETQAQQNKTLNQPVAMIGDEPYYLEQLDYLSDVYRESDNEKTSREIVEHYVTQELVFREAKEQGVELSVEEYQTALADIKLAVASDEEAYSALLSFCDSAGLSEGEYWELAAPDYEELWTINKYRIYLHDQYQTAKKGAGDAKEFAEQYEQYEKSLLQKYGVTIY